VNPNVAVVGCGYWNGKETVTVLRPPKGWIPIDLRELWAYRELLFFFVWRDIKVRYRKYLLEQGIDVRVWGSGWQKLSSEPCLMHPRGPVRRALEIRRALQTKEGWHALKEHICHLAGVEATCPSPSAGKEEHITLPSRILGGTLSDMKMVRMYSRSKINLGFSSCGNTHESGERILQVRLRDFEVPMSGGFYMVEYMEEMEEFFSIGKKIVCYSGKEDLVDKIQYYLRHDEERERIRQAGHERCLQDHTWQKRFRMAFREMSLD